MSSIHQQSPDLRLLQISDTHLHATRAARMRGMNTYDSFRAVLERAEASPGWPPAGIIVSGDIVQDESRAGYELFRDEMKGFGIRVYCLPGNHDDPKLMSEILSGGLFQFCGSARLGNWSVILLNTFLAGEDAGGLGTRRLDALAAELDLHVDRHVMICMHHHPLKMGSAWLDGVALRDADRFLDLINGRSNVRAVIWGHVHQASDRTLGQVRFLSAPSTCSQFLPGSDVFAIDDRPPGMRWLSLHADGRIDTKVVWVENFSG